MRAVVLAMVPIAATATIAAPARAEPTDLVARPLVLADGELEAQLVVEANLRARRVGRPISFAPDLWFGVTPRLTVGLIHSNRSVDQIDTGAMVCLRGAEGECDHGYRGSGLDARYAIDRRVALRVRALLRDVDPVKPAVTLGALVRWQRGRFAITGDPYLRLGLANRDRGNRAAIVLPVWLAIQPTCRWVIALRTGIDGELAVLRDGWHVPVGLVAGVRPVGSLELVVEAGFPSLLGPQNQATERVLVVAVGWRRDLTPTRR